MQSFAISQPITTPSVRAQQPNTVGVPHIILRTATSVRAVLNYSTRGLLLLRHNDQQFFQVCLRLLTMLMATPDQIIHRRQPSVRSHELEGQVGPGSEAKPDRILAKNPGGPARETDLSPGEEGGDELPRHGIVVAERQDGRLACDQLDHTSVGLLPLEAGLP